jgi:putative transposase
LKDLAQGIIPPSKAPKHRNKSQWGEAEKQLVLEFRRDGETYGKEKIGAILRRDKNQTISDSTIVRILGYLRAKGLIPRSRPAPQKCKRNFSKGRAKGWNYKDHKDIEVGERVQIDHMTATKNGVTFKHFQAWERWSKHIHAQVYSNATARSAKRFLLELVEIAPYKILSIQVDGGSEFMADFETACEQMKTPLIVLPPARPKYNGGVERGNRTFREEFYACRDLIADRIIAMRFDLRKAVKKYNTFRPHHALKGKTPMECLRITQAEAA